MPDGRTRNGAGVSPAAGEDAAGRATKFAILTSLVALAVGPVSALLVARRFSPAMQGFYYTFSSLASLQVVAEMGLGQALAAVSGHDCARLSLSGAGIDGPGDVQARLVALMRKVVVSRLCTAALFVVIMLALGGRLFARESVPFAWTAPWAAVCVLTGVNFAFVPFLSLVQGFGRIGEYWVYRFVQQVVAGPVVWLAILTGLQLWAGGVAAAMGVAVTAVFLWSWFPQVLKLPLRRSAASYAWWRDFWPLQWRTGVSALAGYAVTLLLPAITFRVAGAVPAGQMGLTVTLSYVLLSLVSSLVVPLTPLFASMVARGDLRALQVRFDRTLWKACVLSLVSLCALYGAVVALSYFGSPLSARLLPPAQTLAILVAAAAVAVMAAMSSYLRAFREDPLAVVGLGGGVISLALAWWAGLRFGTAGIACVYVAVVGAVQLPIAIAVYRKRRGVLDARADRGFGAPR